ncbi:MAG: histidine phosphatase family protein [Anaerolineae bacterium]|nr:histidine phosphatase family protein [Anaerolineae bacterium]
MPQLVLVKHSNSDHNPLQPAADWPLTAEGLRRCRPLAQHLKPYRAKRLYSSPMPKAIQTAKRVALELNDVPLSECPLLAEHSRQSNAPYGSLAEFHARMKRLFPAPNELAFGDETAEEAKHRFRRGIESILESSTKAENIVVISHGTVIVLFAAQYNPIDSFQLWQSLKMPSLVVLDLPDFRISKVIEDAGIL